MGHSLARGSPCVEASSAHREGQRKPEVIVGEFVPIESEGGRSGRPDRVDPGRQIVGGDRLQWLRGLILDLGPVEYVSGSKDHLDAQARAGSSRTDGVEVGLETAARTAGPIGAVETEQLVFDRIPAVTISRHARHDDSGPTGGSRPVNLETERAAGRLDRATAARATSRNLRWARIPLTGPAPESWGVNFAKGVVRQVLPCPTPPNAELKITAGTPVAKLVCAPLRYGTSARRTTFQNCPCNRLW